MNVGSVPLAINNQTSVPGDTLQTSVSSGGRFGSVLAGMTKNVEIAKSTESSDRSGSIAETISDIFSATNVDELTATLEELTQIPQEDILNGIGKLGQASKFEDWTKALEMDPAELMETISALLEEAGVSKEELAEVMYSNDIWTLLSAANEHTPGFSKGLEEMLISKDHTSQQKATNVLALLKTVETVLPTKDLLGWQQTSLTQLSIGLSGITKYEVFHKLNENSVSPNTNSVFMNAMLNVTKSSQPQSSNDGESDQNQSQLLQNTSNQPIVSRNVFSLETSEARSNSQSEVLLEKLQGLFKQANFGQQGGTNRLLVKLNPEQLGQIRIELIQMNGVMTARILASTALGKEMLDSQLHQLRQSFSQQNIQVDRIDVTQAVQDPARNDRSQNFNQQQFKGNDDQPEQQEHEHGEQQSFQELLLDLEV